MRQSLLYEALLRYRLHLPTPQVQVYTCMVVMVEEE